MKRVSISLAALGVAVAVASTAWATIPGADGLIRACYDAKEARSNNGTDLRIIDTEQGASCKGANVEVAFNQQGPPGAKGDPGEQGPKGDTGEQGPKGDTGEQGPKGDKGDQGPKGDTGEQGLKGDKGDTGDPGTDGVSGWVHLTEATASSSTSPKALRVECPTGKKVVGGGATTFFATGGTGLALATSQPSIIGSSHGWFAEAEEYEVLGSSESWTLRVHVICTDA